MDGFVSTIVWETALRLIGAFYALTPPLVLRAAAMDALLDDALDALGSKTPPGERRAGRLRRRILTANSILVGIGGVWLMALSSAATINFVVCALAYAAYVLVLAPRFLDPFDEPDDTGRRQTRNALVIYLIATGLVIAAQASGVLVAMSALSSPAFWFAIVLSALLPAYAGWLLLRPGMSRDMQTGSPLADVDFLEPAPEDEAAWRALLVPAWERGVLVDPFTFMPVHEMEAVDISDEEWHLMGQWRDLFLEIADPHDPRRQTLLHPERQAELEANGQAIYDALRRKLPPDRIAFEPMPRAHLPTVFPISVKLMPDYGCWPLWHDGDDDVGNIEPYDLGLSFALTQDMLAWANEFEASLDWQNPAGPPLWGAARFAEHDREGAALAVRLEDELRRTGRGNVAVRHVPYSTNAVARSILT